MTVEKAIQSFKDRFEEIDPSHFLASEVGMIVLAEQAEMLAFLRQVKPEIEESQERSNQEWSDLIAQENDPVEAGLLIVDWISDRNQAKRVQREFEQWSSQPEEFKRGNPWESPPR